MALNDHILDAATHQKNVNTSFYKFCNADKCE